MNLRAVQQIHLGRKHGLVERALASLQCNPGSVPSIDS